MTRLRPVDHSKEPSFEKCAFGSLSMKIEINVTINVAPLTFSIFISFILRHLHILLCYYRETSA